MFHRLVRRSVFAEPDRVVRETEDRWRAHERGQADRVAHVVGEDKERASVWADAAMHSHPVHRRSHPVFADAVVDVSPRLARIESNF